MTTLLAGTRARDKPQDTFGTDASPEEFAALTTAERPDDLPRGRRQPGPRDHRHGRLRPYPRPHGYQAGSDGQQPAITADTANHHVWPLQQPDRVVRLDADKPAAAATRRQVFGMIAADRIPFIGDRNMPLPGIGQVETAGEGFRHVPASDRLMLTG